MFISHHFQNILPRNFFAVFYHPTLIRHFSSTGFPSNSTAILILQKCYLYGENLVILALAVLSQHTRDSDMRLSTDGELTFKVTQGHEIILFQTKLRKFMYDL